LISNQNLKREAVDYRVNIRRWPAGCACPRRPTGAGGVKDGPPNSRSKNDGPEDEKPPPLLAKLTPGGSVVGGRL
jgi:hypothetical protein